MEIDKLHNIQNKAEKAKTEKQNLYSSTIHLIQENQKKMS